MLLLFSLLLVFQEFFSFVFKKVEKEKKSVLCITTNHYNYRHHRSITTNTTVVKIYNRWWRYRCVCNVCVFKEGANNIIIISAALAIISKNRQQKFYNTFYNVK